MSEVKCFCVVWPGLAGLAIIAQMGTNARQTEVLSWLDLFLSRLVCICVSLAYLLLLYVYTDECLGENGFALVFPARLLQLITVRSKFGPVAQLWYIFRH